MTEEINTALASTVEFWKNTTKTDTSGNRLTPLNRNFNSGNTSIMTVCHTPGGVEGAAVTLGPIYIGSTTAAGRAEVGGSAAGRSEFMLNPAAILIRATSRANANGMTITCNWYEHQPDPGEPA